MTSKNTAKKTTVAKRPSSRPQHYPWQQVREVYVEGITDSDGDVKWPSLAETAERFGAPAETVRKKSAVEHWPHQREAFQKQLAARRQLERSKKLAKESIQFDTDAMNTAKIGIAMVQRRLGEIAEAYRDRETRKAEAKEAIMAGNFPPLDADTAVIDARELETLARAGETFHRLGHAAMGDELGVRHKIEHSGKDGGPIQTAISVSAQLHQPDGQRVKDFFAAAERAGIRELLEGSTNNIVEGEVVDEPGAEVAVVEEDPEDVERTGRTMV